MPTPQPRSRPLSNPRPDSTGPRPDPLPGDADGRANLLTTGSLPAEILCTERIIIPTFNAEFVPEADDGPCIKKPVLRLTIRHDGTLCGCEGTCQIPDPKQPGSDPSGRWTEERLLCDDHVYEYRAAGALDAQPPAVAIEDLT